MLLDEHFQALVEEIMALGYDLHTATDYAARIGDRPIIDGGGHVVVQRGKEVIARLNLFSMTAAD